MAFDYLCIGHACCDISVSMADFPAEDSKSEVEDIRECGGGPSANAAFLLGKWGVRCAFAGLVGDDRYGTQVLEEFGRVGVDCRFLSTQPGHVTPLSIIIVNGSTGSRTVINRKRPGLTLKLDKEKLGFLSPKVMLFDGHEPDAAMVAMDAFPDAITILDAGSARVGSLALAGKVRFLATSRRFASEVTGLDMKSKNSWRSCIRELRARYQNKVIVTLGADGLVADDGAGYFHLPAFPAKAVDTTAAGDIFHGALAHALGKKMDFKEALRFASMAASLSVQVQGGRSSIPARAQVREALSGL